MKVYLGSDHGGFNLKEELKAWLIENSIAGEDLGASTFNPEDDYPDFVFPVAEAVAGDEDSMGIVIGRSGNGEQIAANKVKGIRAVLCCTVEMAKKAREHNNANVLALGADYISDDEAKEIVEAFIETHLSNDGRHARRLKKISDYENR